MGHSTAQGFADAVNDGYLSLNSALHHHLTANHFPPVPVAFVPVCNAAIDAANEDESDRLITLPEGIEWKDGREAVEAWRLVESFHLDSFVDSGWDE